MKIKKWLCKVKIANVAFTDFSTVVKDAGHHDLDRLQHIQVLVLAMGLPPSPLSPATSLQPS